MSTDDLGELPSPEELRSEARRVMREQHVNYTTAQMIVMKSYRLKQRIAKKEKK